MLLGSSPVPNVLRIVFVVSPIDQLFFFIIYARSECSKPEQLVVTFAAGYIGKLFLVYIWHFTFGGSNISSAIKMVILWWPLPLDKYTVNQATPKTRNMIYQARKLAPVIGDLFGKFEVFLWLAIDKSDRTCCLGCSFLMWNIKI